MMNFRLILLIIISMLIAGNMMAKDLITAEKLWSLKRIGTTELSPDGKNIVFTITTPDFEENSSNTDLYLIGSDGGDMKRLTYSGKHNSNPCWSPDSKKIAFISDRDGSAQAYILDLNGGDAKKVTDMEKGISFLSWSPKGKHLAFVSDVKIDLTLSEIYEDLPKANAKIYTDLPVRHWDKWTDEYFRHLFVLNIETSELKDLMKNERFDTPLRPFGGGHQIAWSPDGSDISYTCKKVDDFESSTNSSVYTAPIYGGQTIEVSKGNTRFPMAGFDMEPLYSPNGAYIAFKSMKRAGFEADKIRLITYAKRTARFNDVTEKFDDWVGNYVWDPKSKYIYFSSIKEGKSQIFKLNISSKKVETIISGVYNYGDKFLAVSPDGKTLYFNRRNMDAPSEIFKMPSDGDEEEIKQLTNVNTEEMSKLESVKIEERWIGTRDNQKVHCWVVYPPNFDPNKKYPMITYCQGGPQQAISQYWSFGWNFKLMASEGYIVLAPNRRGCPGYGQDWVDAISQDWGGAPMNDILDATDTLAKEQYVDENRMAAIGGSAGGYATFWLEGNHEKRFKAFVSHCGVFNVENKHGSTEELWFPNWEYNGEFLSNEARAQYAKNSPHMFADKWDTPILIITGEKDFRVPYDQSLQAFTLAQIKGIPSELLYYPEENHWVLHPQEKILWYREFFKFLKQYVR